MTKEVCPKCNSSKISYWQIYNNTRTCDDCGHSWEDELPPVEQSCQRKHNCFQVKFDEVCRGGECDGYIWDSKTLPSREETFSKTQLKIIKRQIKEANDEH